MDKILTEWQFGEFVL